LIDDALFLLSLVTALFILFFWMPYT